MLTINEKSIKTWSELGARGAFGKVMNDIGENCPDVVVLTADLADATRVREFSKLYPERFFQMGIAEQNLIGVAAGFALSGKIAVATTFAAFATMRCCDQVRTDVAYMNLNVKILGADAGVVMGTLGTTHYAIEDVSIFRAIPNMVILSPADGLEIVKSTWAAIKHQGPVYIRLTGAKNNPIVYSQDYEFEIGKAVTLREGNDATLIATGTIVARALEAAEDLKKKGLAVRVINMHTIKPIDTEAIKKAIKETRLLVTVEEHNIIGGLGAAVAEVMAEVGNAPRLIRIGLPDKFSQIATYPTMLERAGLTADKIADKVKNNL